MNQETMHPDANEYSGMTPAQEQEAMQLREKFKAATNGVRNADAEKHRFERAEMNGGVFGGLNLPGIVYVNAKPVVKRAQRVIAGHKATKHFKQNEQAYQEQALKEAQEAGQNINGWPNQ
jgi:hypothetical protein